MDGIEFQALWLSFKLAVVSTAILLLLCIPLARWLTFSQSRFVPFVRTLTAMPLVLPPTVLGFYLLQLLGQGSWIGQFFLHITGETLIFSFTGLVVASVVYSLPFVVQPMTQAFEKTAEVHSQEARLLGAKDKLIFRRIILPLSKSGLINAAVLGFAHTLGEFGVVLMIGGNIPGETRVVSIAIFDHVESLNYLSAHVLSGILLGLSFIILWFVYQRNSKALRYVV
ncbi:molybdate ABC transporter permease subunit [Marinicella sp. W31]|uniref:molybdate ABC transporter permease subunit n=1 Tax=Marinicella sp. W31 TaxID=3023713 RepID=UPI0037581ED9